MVANNRIERLFGEVKKQIPNIENQSNEFILHVDAPVLLSLAPNLQGVELQDLLKWSKYRHGIPFEIASAISFMLFYRLVGVEGLIDPATPEEWMQLGREIKETFLK